MCDYSLHGVSSRPANVGDRLTVSTFCNTLTRGFSAAEEPETAVCLLPGTELVFEQNVELHHARIQTLFFHRRKWTIPHRVARFRQIDLDNANTHHDAVEFPDGRIVLLTRLKAGQRATVLQLPTRSQPRPDTKTVERTGRHVDAR